jgi:hypothetical protein
MKIAAEFKILEKLIFDLQSLKSCFIFFFIYLLTNHTVKICVQGRICVDFTRLRVIEKKTLSVDLRRMRVESTRIMALRVDSTRMCVNQQAECRNHTFA